MEETDRLHIMAELEGSNCDLEHHDKIEHPAVDSIIVPMGFQESEGVYVQDSHFTIFVCEECMKSLCDPNDGWTLMYCLNCNNSQWIFVPYTTNPEKYTQKINWLKKCPKCKEK